MDFRFLVETSVYWCAQLPPERVDVKYHGEPDEVAEVSFHHHIIHKHKICARSCSLHEVLGAQSLLCCCASEFLVQPLCALYNLTLTAYNDSTLE